MAHTESLIGKLTNIADAIREKTGETAALTLDGMAAAIEGIETTPEMATLTITKTTDVEGIPSFMSTVTAYCALDGTVKSYHVSTSVDISVPVGALVILKAYAWYYTTSTSTSAVVTTANPAGISATMSIMQADYKDGNYQYRNRAYALVVTNKTAAITVKFY